MLNCVRWKLIVLLHTFCAVSLFPQTLLIETRVKILPQPMNPKQRTKITALETGIMDVLFDRGYIVFNRISVQGEGTTAMMDREGIKFAIERDADLLLVLVPDRQGALWSLVQVENANKLDGGFVNISAIAQDDSEMKRWILLGNSLATASLSALDATLRTLEDANLRGLKEIWRPQ